VLEHQLDVAGQNMPLLTTSLHQGLDDFGYIYLIRDGNIEILMKHKL
jgi:hypothetical protein